MKKAAEYMFLVFRSYSDAVIANNDPDLVIVGTNADLNDSLVGRVFDGISSNRLICIRNLHCS